MQATSKVIEREAARRLPKLLDELLGEQTSVAPTNGGSDLAIKDATGRTWLAEIKGTSGPAVVARAAEQLQATREQAIPVLVVPYMTPAGAAAASARDLNWIDLSGNAHIRAENLYVSREGRPNAFPARGRPSSPFASKSARIARVLLQDPERWWRQSELASETGLDDGHVSRIIRRLGDDQFLERDQGRVRPVDPDLLLDAWTDEYRFDRHDTIVGHVTGSGIELARDLSEHLRSLGVDHALTGLPAAWLMDHFAGFRLVSIYVEGDPRAAADDLGLRLNERGANVQLVGPDDESVYVGRETIEDLPVVSSIQTYLDLRHLPERAAEAADHLRSEGRLWPS